VIGTSSLLLLLSRKIQLHSKLNWRVQRLLHVACHDPLPPLAWYSTRRSADYCARQEDTTWQFSRAEKRLRRNTASLKQHIENFFCCLIKTSCSNCSPTWHRSSLPSVSVWSFEQPCWTVPAAGCPRSAALLCEFGDWLRFWMPPTSHPRHGSPRFRRIWRQLIVSDEFRALTWSNFCAMRVCRWKKLNQVLTTFH